MSLLRRINDEQAERLLAGLGPDQNGAPDHGDVASFVRALALTVPADPGPEYEAGLVPRLAETARVASGAVDAAPTATLRERGGVRRPRLRFATAIAVAALVPAFVTGLAFAGVTLPEPARSAFERVGIELPNQAAVDESATSEETGDESASSGDHGKGHNGERGQGASKSNGKSDSKGANGKAHGHGRGKGHAGSPGTHGNSASAPGQQGTAPGLQETTPGQSDAAPPGQGGTPPGETFEPAAPQGSSAPSSPPAQSKPE
jgi:hypothetical protein